MTRASIDAGPSIEGMFNIGGHKLHLECYGEGSPTIVLKQRRQSDVFLTYR